jgi:PPOX class probable F420-dependent enzyme
MPKLPLPAEVDAFLREPNPAVIATLRRDGSSHTAATWYDWDGQRVLVNMDRSRRRLENMQRDPRVSLTVLGADDWYRQVTVFGHAAEVVGDPELADIDRLSKRYTGRAHRSRGRDSVSAWIELESWYGWSGGSHWPHA